MRYIAVTLRNGDRDILEVSGEVEVEQFPQHGCLTILASEIRSLNQGKPIGARSGKYAAVMINQVHMFCELNGMEIVQDAVA